MKIHLPVIRNFSGADVYFQRLAQGLSDCNVTAALRFYPHLMEFLPYHALAPFLADGRDCELVHTKAEYGWMFHVPGRPLVVKLAHSVFDPNYETYKNVWQRLHHSLKLWPSITRSLAAADRIVTVSRFSADRISDAFGRRDIRVIYNGVDFAFFRPAPSLPATKPPTRLLFVGNCTVRKGFDLLAPIMSRLGDGFVLEYTSGLRSAVKPPPHPAMHPLGCLSEQALLAAYQRCDILLAPSRLEGFGYPVAEAMACGKPVVCTDYSSLPELIDDGLGGYLCPRDDVDAFVDRIRWLAADTELRARMGVCNRTKVEQHFSLPRCVQQYIELYQELL